MKKIKTSVVGVTHKNEDGKPRQWILGVAYDRLWTEGYEHRFLVELRHEPDNPVDENAVGVWVTAPGKLKGRIGFLDAKHAAGKLGDAVREDRIRHVRVFDMGTAKGGGVWLKILIKISEEEDLVEDEDGNTFEYD